MNNLHRELAPISDGAWAQIEEEAQRTLKRYLAGRRVVDVKGPGGLMLSAVGTGHLSDLAAPGDGIIARQRQVKALVELRAPFQLDRQAIDDVDRGANDSDWQPLKERRSESRLPKTARSSKDTPPPESKASGKGPATKSRRCPATRLIIPTLSPRRLSQLRLAGVNGPYSVVMGADAYTALSEASDHGYPVIQHIQRLVNEEIIFAPAIAGAFVLTTRGGDFELHLGQDVSIGYLEPRRQERKPVPAGNDDLPAADSEAVGRAQTRIAEIAPRVDCCVRRGGGRCAFRRGGGRLRRLRLRDAIASTPRPSGRALVPERPTVPRARRLRRAR